MFPRCGTLLTYGSALVTSTFRLPFSGARGGPVTSRYGEPGSVITTGAVSASGFTGPFDPAFPGPFSLSAFGAVVLGGALEGAVSDTGLEAWGLAVWGFAAAAARESEMAFRDRSARVWGFWPLRMVLMAGATCSEAIRALSQMR